jgi:hypothetical protein
MEITLSRSLTDDSVDIFWHIWKAYDVEIKENEETA